MKELSVVIIDTYKNKSLASNAISMAARLPNVKKIYTFSDEPFFLGATFIKVTPIKSNNDYGSIIFELLPKYIQEEHFLIIQWDGFPLFPNNWDQEFLNFDYIGAPLDTLLQNGGFSLRSKKLLEACQKLSIKIDKNNSRDQPEDQIICLENRIALEKRGIRFAPIDIANQFSYQTGLMAKKILGFHAPENLPIFIDEGNLVPLADDIIERIPQPLILLRYLTACARANFYDLFKESVLNYESKPNLVRAINYEASINPDSDLLNLIKQLN